MADWGPEPARHRPVSRVGWRVVVTARVGPRAGAVPVTVATYPVAAPESATLREALDWLEPAVAPGDDVQLVVDGMELLVGDPEAWPTLVGLPRCVTVVVALGHRFDLRDPESARLWRLALRLAAEDSARRAADGGCAG